ncbi:hypothetical protein SUDANB1_01548 [Streptomyces sp. enrichment culture]|uniref:DUF6098 family protein n=1 Tax=Streptomyces sp. enrichment culture TaxID=1795815 RepID=UPI003F54ACDD
MNTTADLPTFSSLDELAQLITHRHGLYVRWSRGPESDLPKTSSTDDLTGIKLPGLSASPLDLEDWWGERPVRVWVARRLYDYCHLPHVKDVRARPWVLRGSERARGPDNEPLVTEIEPLGWIADQVITDACRIITEQPGHWGTLDRDEPFEEPLSSLGPSPRRHDHQ